MAPYPGPNHNCPRMSHCPSLTRRGTTGTPGTTNRKTMKHYYNLQRYAGPSSRHTCPACGRPRCFTLYVDPDGNPLHETVGRCDHESSCGYHRTPRQYFHDHPERNRRHPDSFHCHPERLSVISSKRNESSHRRSRLSSSERNRYRHARPDLASPL